MFKKITGLLRNESGAMMMLVVGVVIILTLLGFAIIARGSNDQLLTMKNVEGTKALHVADAGVQQAIWRVTMNLANESTTNFSMDLESVGGHADVTIQKDSGAWYWTITSVGRVGEVSRTIKMTLFYFSLWDVDMSTGQGVAGGNGSGMINGNASFTGPLYVQGGFRLSGNASYEGGPLMINEGSLILAGSGTAGTALQPIEAYIHPTGDQYPIMDRHNNEITGPPFYGTLSTEVPRIKLPAMGSLTTYRLNAYNQSLVDESSATVYPGIQWNVALGSYGEKILDNNNTCDAKPTGNNYRLDSTIGAFGFNGASQQMYGLTVNPPERMMNAFAWDGSTIYLSNTGDPMTIYVDGNLTIGDNGNSLTKYKGKGTIVVNGNLTVKGKLRASNIADFPLNSGLGLVVNGTLTLEANGGSNDYNNPDYQGAWYAATAINFNNNNAAFVGTIMSLALNFEQNAHCWTHSQLSTNLPPDLPGSDNKVQAISGWREIIKQ